MKSIECKIGLEIGLTVRLRRQAHRVEYSTFLGGPSRVVEFEPNYGIYKVKG
jgi:hypothetical protein